MTSREALAKKKWDAYHKAKAKVEAKKQILNDKEHAFSIKIHKQRKKLDDEFKVKIKKIEDMK